VIPPAWSEVWISVDEKGHIQATGYDAAGRKQYIYHPDWEAVRDEAKFERMGEFGTRISSLRRQVDADLRLRGLAREKVVALAVAVLDRTLIRVGNRRYALENEAYGLTTLTCEHVTTDGSHVHLEFEGKGLADHQLAFRDVRLASLIARCQELSGQTLFSYETENGSTSVTSSDVNQYLADRMGGPFSAKDFRTWGASSTVAGQLGRLADGDQEVALRQALEVAADRLGNSPQVCRESYLHPLIPEAFYDGRLAQAWRQSRRGKWTDRAEAAVNRILA
jgi:DNA topoisomerase-1